MGSRVDPRWSRRKLVGLVAGVGGLLLLIGVGVTSLATRTTQSSDRPIVVRVGYMKIADCAPLMMKEVFASHGLSLELKEAPGGAVILDSVIGGGLDIGFSNLVSPILARARGIHLVSVGGCTYEDSSHSRHGLIAVNRGNKEFTPSELKDRTVAVNTLRNIDHLLLNRFLRDSGVAPESVRLIEVPFPRMSKVVQKDEVAAAAIVDPFLTQARLDGLEVLADYYANKETARVEVTSYFARESWAKENKKVVEKFRDALKDAVAKSLENEQQFRARVADLSSLSAEVAKEMSLPAFSDAPSIAGLNHLIGCLVEEGFLENRIEASELLAW